MQHYGTYTEYKQNIAHDKQKQVLNYKTNRQKNVKREKKVTLVLKIKKTWEVGEWAA